MTGEAGIIQSVILSFRVLELLAERGPLGVTDTAKALGINKVRVFRHMRTLSRAGYVEQDPATEKYQVTGRLFLIGQQVAENVGFLAAARRVMRPLRDKLGHAVTISQVEDVRVLVLDMVRGSSPFEISTRPGARLPLTSSAQGKLVLAFGDPALRMAAFAGVDPGPDTRRLEREIALAAERGWAVAPEEILPGINALAAPIFEANGQLSGTLAMVDSVQFIPAEPSSEQVRAILAAAAEASRALGYAEAAQ
jgi:DNA-binding IclR family transcriptional regulator